MPEEGVNPFGLPMVMNNAWTWFLQLAQTRTEGLEGKQPISSMEMWAFFQLSGEKPEPWEIAAIRKLDVLARHGREPKPKEDENGD